MTMSWKRKRFIERVKFTRITLHCERWLDEKGAEIDYWRAERPDSVIVLPLHRGRILVPPPYFRPGANVDTIDLPGGRLRDNESVEVAARRLLDKELGIGESGIEKIRCLNTIPWNVDSSFSSQRLWGAIAWIIDSAEVLNTKVWKSFPANEKGVVGLLGQINCLQCRAILNEWQIVCEDEA